MLNWQNVSLTKCHVDKMSCRQKCHVDKMSCRQKCHIDKICHIYKMSHWENAMLTKCHIYEMSHCGNVNDKMWHSKNVIFMKWLMSYLWNVMLLKCNVDEISCWWNVMLMKSHIDKKAWHQFLHCKFSLWLSAVFSISATEWFPIEREREWVRERERMPLVFLLHWK